MAVRGSPFLVLALVGACGGGSPLVAVLAPDAAVEVPRGTLLEIRYVDRLPPNGGTTSLYADGDGDPTTEGDRVPISTGRPGAGGVVQVVLWDTGADPAGSYFLVAVAERDGRVTVAATTFVVVVNAPPAVTILEPATETVVRPGGRLEVRYVDDDPDDVATTDLVLDSDGDPATTGDRFVLAPARPDENGAPQIAASFLEAAPNGLYFVVATTTDGKNAPVSATAPGRVRIERGTFNEIRGPGERDQAQHVAAYADGSCVVAGRYEAPITLAEGTADETTLAATDEDIFVAKYDPRGRLAWARRITGPGDQAVGGLLAFPDGSCAVTGTTYEGTAILGEGEPGEARFAAQSQSSNFFLGRYDASGRLLWARGGQTVRGALVLADGAAALPGGALAAAVRFHGFALTLNAGLPDERTVSPGASIDALLVRYEADGSLGWVARAGSGGNVVFPRCAAHADGSVAFVSVIFGTVTFGAGEPNETTFVAPGSGEIVLAFYAPDGTLRWARHARNDGASNYREMRVVATPDGGSAVAGEFSAETTFGPGEPGETSLPGGGLVVGFVARYAADGTFRWARQIGGGASDYVRSLAASPAGEIVVAGHTYSTLTFGAGEPTEKTVPAAGTDLYFAHYDDSDGDFLRLWRFAPAATNRLLLRADIASFPDGSLVVAASCGPTATFAPGTPMETTFTSASGTDVVLAVLDRTTIDAISE